MEAQKACPEVQVFNSQYRENQAKRMAKVESKVTYLFSFAYSISDCADTSTGRLGYGLKCNFRTIALGAGTVSNGTGAGGHGPFGQVRTSKTVTEQLNPSNQLIGKG
jgi:hypothetical protein